MNQTVLSDSPVLDELGSPETGFELSYSIHAPINIVNDTDFADQGAIEQWEGDGSEGSPYILEGYNITDASQGIRIVNVTKYFEIRNCLVNDTTGMRDGGIMLLNVTHGKVIDCVVSNMWIGISIEKAPGCIIDNCTVYNSDSRGIQVDFSNYTTVNDCEVYDGYSPGIRIGASIYCNITNNEVYDKWGAALSLFEGSHFSNITGNTLYDNGGPGISLFNSNNITIQDNTAYDNSRMVPDCGIDAYNSANCSVIDNELYDNEYAGINLYGSPNWDIIGNTIYNNSDHGIYGIYSENCTISNNDIYENGWWGEMEPTCGIAFGETERWHIEGNSIWNNSANGVYVQADFTTITNNEIFNNTNHGIYSTWTDNVTVTNNTIYGNGWNFVEVPERCGIYLYKARDWIINQNTIYNNTDNGIYLEGYGYNNITNNEIYDNANDGIYSTGVVNCNVIANTIYDNAYDGIDLSECSYWNITNNIIFDNAQYGVNLDPTDECWVYYNDIGWNSENAYDWSDWNYWDNVTIGNWWHDYSGFGNYTIPGPAAVNDTAPSKSMYVQAASPMEYEVGTTGHTMAWTAYALNPDSYEFYVDEELFDSDSWDGSDIDVDVTGLEIGLHDVMLIVYHVSGHSFNETSEIDVVDTSAPTWDVTPVTTFNVEFGASFSYDLNASDPTGIDEWWLNTTAFSVDSNGFVENATSLAVGDYAVLVSVNDTLGHTLSVILNVHVNDTIAPELDLPPEIPVLEFGESFSLQLSASDLSGIGGWSVNDTAHFSIDETGLLTNVTNLESGVYVLSISVEDIYGNTHTFTLTITINEAPAPTTPTTTTTPTATTTPTTDQSGDTTLLLLAFGGGAAALIVVVVLIGVNKKRGG